MMQLVYDKNFVSTHNLCQIFDRSCNCSLFHIFIITKSNHIIPAVSSLIMIFWSTVTVNWTECFPSLSEYQLQENMRNFQIVFLKQLHLRCTAKKTSKSKAFSDLPVEYEEEVFKKPLFQKLFSQSHLHRDL